MAVKPPHLRSWVPIRSRDRQPPPPLHLPQDAQDGRHQHRTLAAPAGGPDDIVTPVTEDRAAPQCGGPRNYLHDRAAGRWPTASPGSCAETSARSRPAIGFFGHVRGVTCASDCRRECGGTISSSPSSAIRGTDRCRTTSGACAGPGRASRVSATISGPARR